MAAGSNEKVMMLRGMHGLGDNIHQRAILRQKMSAYPDHQIYLTSSWVSIYHDLIPLGLRVVKRDTPLRVQTKNARREHGGFYRGSVPPLNPKIDLQLIWYRPEQIDRLGSVVAAMCDATSCDPQSADFTLPVPQEWITKAAELLNNYGVPMDRPIMLYRPLVERKDWGGCAARNPTVGAYMALYEAIREHFYVISIADLVPGVEWISSPEAHADLEFHKGQLSFEILAALFQWSHLVFASPGFAIPLAQAVGTPNVCVFGGFEKPNSFLGGEMFAPHLPLAPLNPCGCWKHKHNCDKSMDVSLNKRHLKRFAEEYVLDVWQGAESRQNVA